MSKKNTHQRRSVLYVPATNARAMTKAWTLGTDSIVFDLEDAVASCAKAGARQALVSHLAEHRRAGVEIVIRVNAVGSPEFKEDIAAIAITNPDAVLLPKVDSPEDLRMFNDYAARFGLARNVRTWSMVETPKGIVALDSIVTTGVSLTHTLDCLVVGTNDIAKETGIWQGDQRKYLVPWLMDILLIAKRHGISVLDGVWNDFKNQTGFEAEALQGMRMGFDGKTLIHPTQVGPVNRVFSPSHEAIEAAQRIVDAFSDPAHIALNVINLDGRMVERLHFEQAKQLLEKHTPASNEVERS